METKETEEKEMETIARVDDDGCTVTEDVDYPKKRKLHDVYQVEGSIVLEESPPVRKKGEFDDDDLNKQGVELDLSGVDLKEGGEEKDLDDEKEEDDEDEDGEEKVMEEFRMFHEEEVEEMEVKRRQYSGVKLTEEEKKYYESPEYNGGFLIKENVEEGSMEFHWMTRKERAIYDQLSRESKGFDVPLLPGAILAGRKYRINLTKKEKAMFVAKISKMALIYYNKKHVTGYVLECIEKANESITTVKAYHITFKAIYAAHSDRASTFQAVVHQGVENDIEVRRCRIKGVELDSSLVDLKKGGEEKEDLDEKELDSSGVDLKKGGEEKDLDEKEKDDLEEDDDEEDEDEEEKMPEEFRNFSKEEVEKVEVKPEEYAVKITEEEKKFYESPAYNASSYVIKKKVEEGSMDFHWITKEELALHNQLSRKSKGFDIPLLPGAILPGKNYRMNLTRKENAVFVAKISKLALICYNMKHGTDYVLKCIEKANEAVTAVRTYHINFEAISAAHIDHANTFQAVVHHGLKYDAEVLSCRIRPY